MNLGVGRGTNPTSSFSDSLNALSRRNVIYLAIIISFVALFSIPTFAITPQACDVSCRNEYRNPQWSNQQGKCFLDGSLPGSTYYEGNQIWSAFSTNVPCDTTGRATMCYCVGYDSTYLSQNNLALSQVLSTSCEYTASTNQYMIVIEYLSLGMNTFTVEDTASNTFTRFLAGFQTDVKMIPRASIEQGQTGPDYQKVYRWSAPAVANLNVLFSKPGYPLNPVSTGQNQYQDIPITCHGPQTSSGIDIPALDGAKEIGIREVICGGKQLPNKWNLVDLDVSTSENVTGSCDIIFDNSYSIYGVMIAGEPGAGINSISAGPISTAVNKQIPASGRLFIPMNTDQRGNPPKAGSLRVGFSGTAIINEINPFPDLSLISNLSITPKELVVGDSVAIEGTVNKQLFSASGQYAMCRAGFQSTCKVVDDSKFYIMPLPKVVFDFLTDASIGFPMIKVPIWIPLDWRSGLAIAAIEGLIIAGNKGSIEKIVASALLGYIVYDLNNNYQDYAKDQSGNAECVNTGKDDNGKICKNAPGADTNAGDCVYKCNVRIATIPWFAYHGEPNPGPQHYTFSGDTCVRPDATDLLMLNLPTYLAFGDYWSQERDKLNDRLNQQRASAYANIKDCNSCISRGVSVGNAVTCADITDPAVCKSNNPQGYNPCLWDDANSPGICRPNSVNGKWCPETTTIGGQTYLLKDKGKCIPSDQDCANGITNAGGGDGDLKGTGGKGDNCRTIGGTCKNNCDPSDGRDENNDCSSNQFCCVKTIDLKTSSQCSQKQGICKYKNDCEEFAYQDDVELGCSEANGAKLGFASYVCCKSSSNSLSSLNNQNPFETANRLSFSGSSGSENIATGFATRLSLTEGLGTTDNHQECTKKAGLCMTDDEWNKVSADLVKDGSGTYGYSAADTSCPGSPKNYCGVKRDSAGRALEPTELNTFLQQLRSSVSTTIPNGGGSATNTNTGKEKVGLGVGDACSTANPNAIDSATATQKQNDYDCQGYDESTCLTQQGQGKCVACFSLTRGDNTVKCVGRGVSKDNKGCPVGYKNLETSDRANCAGFKDQNACRGNGCGWCTYGSGNPAAECLPKSSGSICTLRGGTSFVSDPLASDGGACGNPFTFSNGPYNGLISAKKCYSDKTLLISSSLEDSGGCRTGLFCGVRCGGDTRVSGDFACRVDTQCNAEDIADDTSCGGGGHCCRVKSTTTTVKGSDTSRGSSSLLSAVQFRDFLSAKSGVTFQITSTFYAGRAGAYHSGCDIAAPQGTPVYAVYDGETSGFYSSNYRRNGDTYDGGEAFGVNLVTDKGPIEIVYGHLTQVPDKFKSRGSKVVSGEFIGKLQTLAHVDVKMYNGNNLIVWCVDGKLSEAPLFAGQVAGGPGTGPPPGGGPAPARPTLGIDSTMLTLTFDSNILGNVAISSGDPQSVQVYNVNTVTFSNPVSINQPHTVEVIDQISGNMIKYDIPSGKMAKGRHTEKIPKTDHRWTSISNTRSNKGSLLVRFKGSGNSGIAVAIFKDGRYVTKAKFTDASGEVKFVLPPGVYGIYYKRPNSNKGTVSKKTATVTTGRKFTYTFFAPKVLSKSKFGLILRNSNTNLDKAYIVLSCQVSKTIFRGYLNVVARATQLSGTHLTPYIQVYDIGTSVYDVCSLKIYQDNILQDPYYSNDMLQVQKDKIYQVNIHSDLHNDLSPWQDPLSKYVSYEDSLEEGDVQTAYEDEPEDLTNVAFDYSEGNPITYGDVPSDILTNIAGAFITPTGEESVAQEESSPAGNFIAVNDASSSASQSQNNIVSDSQSSQQTSYATASLFANKCKSSVKAGKYFCVDSQIDDGQFFVKGVGTYDKNLETSVIMGNGVYCAYPYVTNEIICDNVGKIVDDYYTETGGEFFTNDNLPLSASSDADLQTNPSSQASIGYNTIDLCSSKRFENVDSLKALGVLDNNVCSSLPNSYSSRSSQDNLATPSQNNLNIVTASGVDENNVADKSEKISLSEDVQSSQNKNNLITGNAINNKLSLSTGSLQSQELHLLTHASFENVASFDGESKQQFNKLSLADVECTVQGGKKGICIKDDATINSRCTEVSGYGDCPSNYKCCTGRIIDSKSTTGTGTKTNVNTNDPFYKDPKKDNARMLLALLQLFTRQDKIRQAAGGGSAYYYREWKTKPSLKQPDCGANDPLLGSGYATSSGYSGSSSGSKTLSNAASNVGANTFNGNPGGTVTVGGNPVGGNGIVGGATGLATGRDNLVNSIDVNSLIASQSSNDNLARSSRLGGESSSDSSSSDSLASSQNNYDTNSYSSEKSSNDIQDSTNLVTGYQVLPSSASAALGRPVGTVTKPFVESGPFQGSYHTTEGAIFSFPTTAYITIFRADGTVANDCAVGGTTPSPTSSTFSDTRTIAVGASVNTDLGGSVYNVALLNFTTASTAIINVTSADGSSVQTVSLGTAKSILGVVVLMTNVANDTTSAAFSFTRSQVSNVGGNASCENIPVVADSNGYFKYFYTPMNNETYKAVVNVQSNGAGPEDIESGLVLQKSGIFTVKPFSPPTISSNRREACSLPLTSASFTPSLVDKATFGIFVQSSGNLTLPTARYIFDITEEPGAISGDAGFEDIDANGNLVLVDRKEVLVSAGQIAAVNLSSAMILPAGENSHTYTIRARVSNSTYNISQEFTFNHTVFRKLAPLMEIVSEPVKRPFDLRPETYFIRITNQNPARCGANNYFLLKEVPPLWSGRVEVDGETDMITLGAGQNAEARLTLTPNPASIQIGKRYEANLITTEGVPDPIQSLVGASDLIGLDTDSQRLYFVGANRIAIFNKTNFTGQSFEANGGRAISVDSGAGGNIYWSEFSQNEGSVFCSSKTRFSGTRIASQADAVRLAVTDNYVYYTDKSGIYRVIKNCVAEQSKERIYFTNTTKILDIAADGSTVYWLETSLNGSVDIRSVGESQIGVGGAIDIFALATRDNLGSLYIAKGTGGIGTSGMSGVYYSTNSTTSRVAQLGSIDRIVFGGSGVTSASNTIIDIALDNKTVYWIDNGVNRISKDNPVVYSTVYYEYRPDSPLLTASPINVSMSPGETRIFNINVTNKAYLPVSYQIKLDNLGTNFTGIFLGKGANFSELFNPRETRGYLLSLTANSSTIVNSSFSICARAMNTTIWPSSSNDSGFTRCIGVLVGVRSQPTLALDIIDARAIVNGTPKVLPADTVWYNLSITNVDGSAFGTGRFNITMSVPNGWNYFIERNMLNISPSSRDSTRIRVETSSTAADGQYELSLNVSNNLDIQRTSIGLNPRVIIHMCGNSVCDLERGEDNIQCPADCPEPGYTNIGGVYLVPSWPNLLQHDSTTSTSVNFSALLTGGLDRSLEQQKILSCVAGSNTSQCKQARDLGVCGFGSSCLAAKNLSAAESIPVMEMRCPADRTENYYLLYTGRRVVNLTPTDIDFVSPNYTYSCPFYNSTGLRFIKASLENKTVLCQQILFNYNNSVFVPPSGKTKSECVDSWRKICDLESNFLRYVNLAMDPGIISVENSRKAFELYSKLNNEVWFTDYHQCEGVVTLFIENIRVGP